MKTYTANQLSQGAAASSAPVFLLSIASWGGGTVRFINLPPGQDQTVSGSLYDARPFNVSGLTVAPGGKNDSLSFTITNTDLAITAMCLADNPLGKIVTIKRVFLDLLTSPITLVDNFKIDAYRINEDVVEFSIIQATVTAVNKFPARQMSDVCPWVFKDVNTCRYAGGESACDHTWLRCVELANTLNFGGFLFVASAEY